MLKINPRFWATSISVAALTVGMAVAQPAQKAAAQTAAGSTAAADLYTGFGLANYQAIGSDGGVAAFRSGSVDIGATGVPVSPQNGEILLPVVNLRIVLPYNNGVGSLSQDSVGAIFRGEITNWSDLGGPDQPITVVYRSDNSGNKVVLNNYVGISGNNYPPNSIGVTSSQDVINTVQNTPGAIGYVEQPSLNGQLPSAVDSPIIGPTYALVRTQYDSADTSSAVKAFFNNILNNDDQVRSLGYEPLADKTESTNDLNSIQP